MPINLRLFFLFFCLFTTGNALADIYGKVVKVVDGDTIHLQTIDEEKIKVRLLGIDAPEIDQSFGNQSKSVLKKLIHKKEVHILSKKKDRYKRILGKILLDGNDINLLMIRKGYAWHYKRYKSDQFRQDIKIYAATEKSARYSGVGLWGELNTIAPWEWRKQKREKNR